MSLEESQSTRRGKLTSIRRRSEKLMSQYRLARVKNQVEKDAGYDGDEEDVGVSLVANSTFISVPSTITSFTPQSLPTRKPRLYRPRGDDKDKTASKVEDESDSGSDDDHNSTSTRISSSIANKATSKPITLTTSTTGALPTAQAEKAPPAPSPSSTTSSSTAKGGGISSANEVSSSQYEAQHKTAEAAIIGTVFGVIGAILLVVGVVFAIKYRRRKRGHQLLSDDQPPMFRGGNRSDQGSVIWGGSVAPTDYHPPVPSKQPWYNPGAARSVISDRVSRLWGGSEAPTPSEFGGNEKVGSNVPEMPAIPAEYMNPGNQAQPTGHHILSRDFEAPPAAYLGSDTTSVREERLDRVRDDLQSRPVVDRESKLSNRLTTATIPRFKSRESWVADQAGRLQIGR